MIYKDLVDEVISIRFKEPERDQVERWVNQRYAMVWGAADWPWKYVAPISLTIDSGDPTPTTVSDFHRVYREGLRDSTNNSLRYLEPVEFFSMYSATDTGTPSDFTVFNGEVHLGPTPSADDTFTLTYERVISCRNAAGTVVGGLMSAVDDQPIWGTTDPGADSFHFLLVPGAISTGLKLQADPTWGDMEDEFERQLAAMVNYFLPPDTPGTLQYGADNLGYEVPSWM